MVAHEHYFRFLLFRCCLIITGFSSFLFPFFSNRIIQSRKDTMRLVKNFNLKLTPGTNHKQNVSSPHQGKCYTRYGYVHPEVLQSQTTASMNDNSVITSSPRPKNKAEQPRRQESEGISPVSRSANQIPQEPQTARSYLHSSRKRAPTTTKRMEEDRGYYAGVRDAVAQMEREREERGVVKVR